MKNFKQFACMSAIALCGAAGLASCSSSDDADNGGGTIPVAEAVKTQFTISLPANAAGRTRQSVETVQGQTTPVFRGLDNMVLIPFYVPLDYPTIPVAPVTSTSARTGNNIVLPGSPDNSLAKNDLFTTNNAKVYADVAIPLTTSAFLFYGKAIDNAAGEEITTDADKHKFGILNAEGLTGEPADIKFSPEPIYTETTPDEKAQNIVAYLNSIAGVEGWSRDMENTGLATMYEDFTSLYAGSSPNIQAAVQDLYSSLKDNTDDMAKKIVEAIKNPTYVSAVTDDKLTFTDAISGYPANINLPDGAVPLTYSYGAFSFTSETRIPGVTAELSKYAYPPSLYYRANTGIAARDFDMTSEYQNGVTWKTILSKFDQVPGTVNVQNRSVALIDQVQYAVGRLDTKVTAAAETLKDRYGKDVHLTDGGFPVTAVIIGGQRAVDFQFEPVVGSSQKQFYIYDNALTGITAGTAGSAVNHTLVLQTPVNEPVYVALELINNTGKDFMGVTGVISAGTHFYLVGKLDPTDTSTATNAGNTGNRVFLQDYVTKANFTIDDNIDGNDADEWWKGLGRAYNTIPDLRAPTLSLGLSVNLEWQEGVTFDVYLNQ